MTDEAQNPFISNYYGTPNILVDRLMPLLTPEEWMVLSFTCRQVLGWEDTIQIKRKRISLTVFSECGLSIGAIRQALAGLERYRIMRRIGRATLEGQLWELTFNRPNIDWPGLEARREKKEKERERRTRKARQTVLQRQRQESAARSPHPPVVGQHGTMLSDNIPPHVVGQHSTGNVGQYRTGDVGQQHRNTLKADDDALEDDHLHHQVFDARMRALLAARFEGVGIAESVWSQWVHYSPDHLLACILHAQGEGANPPGLLRSMLDGDGVPLPKYLEKAQRVLYPEPLPEPIAPDVPPSGLDARIGERDLTITDVWQAVTGQLKLQLNSGTFDTYVRDAQLVRYEEGTLWVMPRYSHARPWYDSQAGLLEQLVTRVAGIPVAVRCATNEAGPAAAL